MHPSQLATGLGPIGYANKQPAIRGTPEDTTQDAEQIAVAPCMLKRTATRKRETAMANSKMRVGEEYTKEGSMEVTG